MIQAIETRYNGYRFRSRLEARWAVFFDAVDAIWQYEPEGYILPSGRWYLPDFLVGWSAEAQQRTGTTREYCYWFEIKGRPPTAEEFDMARALLGRRDPAVCLIEGPPGDEQLYFLSSQCEHQSCQFPVTLTAWCNMLDLDSKDIVVQAYAAARSARFEHGETPTKLERGANE